ncbi:MAG: GIY-YIG nuclease family protein [Cyanobacteria bacterium J06632_3]
MSDPFTIRIFVPNGDPEGVRIIDRMNWTGLGIVFPRDKWQATRNREEFNRTGIYILVGYMDADDDIPTLYIGQGDTVRNRIDSHYGKKDFWDWGVTFVSANNSLNRAHVTWLEYALVNQAQQTKRSRLDNGNTPQEPGLSESEKADTKGFLKEILQILPLVGLRAFEDPKPVAIPKASSHDPVQPSAPQKDTIIVPAQREGFERVFMGEDSWYAIRIAGGKLTKIKYIAAYQTQPISAVTHYAPVDRIEPYGESGKYRVIFSEPAQEITPIPYGDAPLGAMQGLRYTSFQKLQEAQQISDLL